MSHIETAHTFNHPLDPGDRARLVEGLAVFSGTSNPELAAKVVAYLNEVAGEGDDGSPAVALGELECGRFSDGEIRLRFKENLRNRSVFLIQSTGAPAENLMELLLMVDAARRAAATSITAVIPYFGYARQDRKDKPRRPISAKLVAKLLEAAGVHRVVAVDLHAFQIQGFFEVPVDNLFAATMFVREAEGNPHSPLKVYPNTTIVSPDAGGAERVRMFSRRLRSGMAIVGKHRPRPNEVEVDTVIGNVRDRHLILLDDIIDTAGSMTASAARLRQDGGLSVVACATHGVLSGPAIDRINNAEALDRVIVTDTLPQAENLKRCHKLSVVSIAPLLGETILRIQTHRSISALFEDLDQ